MHAYFLRCLQILGILLTVGLMQSASANEDQFTIFEVRKKLPLANDEASVKDYYISAGADSGLKPEMIVDVKRRIPVHDAFKNQSRGDLVVTVGKVRVIHVESGLAVARIFSETSPAKRPITGFETIMIGDFIDISTAAMMVPKEKRKAASVEEKKPAEEKEEAKPSPLVLLPKPTHALMTPLKEAPPLPVPMTVN